MSEPIPEPEKAKSRDDKTAPFLSRDLWQRVKEHKVLQWGLAYLGAALALAHGGDLLGHAFHWPEALNRLLLGVLIVGFPVALALAWYHGHRSLKAISTGEATIISILLVIGAGLLVLFVRPPEATSRQDSPTISSSATALTSSAPLRAPSAASDSGPSIAVLPFVNMSSDREQEYFSDGLSEELLNELSNVPNLRVIGRTSSFAFKGKNEDLRAIGEALGVNHILEGSVRKSGDRLRITAQLINPDDGSHLWSGTYERMLGDVFEIQEDISRTVASALRMSIEATDLRAGGTHNFEAYDEFLRGASERSQLNAIPHLERAVELDPNFAQAWTQLAQGYSFARVFAAERGPEWLQKARTAENRVFALAPQSVAAKVLMATRAIDSVHLLEAERLIESVRTLPTGLTPESGMLYGEFLLSVGRARDALETLKTTLQADPVAAAPRGMIVIVYETLEDFSQAELEYRRGRALFPGNSILASTAILRAMAIRDTAALRQELVSSDSGPLSGADMAFDTGRINRPMAALLNDPAAAIAQLHRWSIDPKLSSEPLLLNVQADWAAYFGDPELSLQLLRRMPRDNSTARLALMFSLWRPVEKKVRRLPGFKDFVREIGLLDYWRTGGKWGDFCRPAGQTDFECN